MSLTLNRIIVKSSIRLKSDFSAEISKGLDKLWKICLI